jgi:hypothetical protein
MKMQVFWIYLVLITISLSKLALAQEEDFPPPNMPQEISEEEQPPLPIMDNSGEVPPPPMPEDDEVYID